MGHLKDLTLQMAQAVVSQPDQVRVEEVEGASMIVLELSVDPQDMGRIIGKEGRVALRKKRRYIDPRKIQCRRTNSDNGSD